MNLSPENPGQPPRGPKDPVVIGLVGGVAAGKSSVARLFEQRGWAVLDADEEARKIVERPEVLAQIEERFGAEVIAADGSLDRQRLADRVFRDETARVNLEAITHPAIRAALEQALASALAKGVSVVLDVPLLLEGDLYQRCDHCVFVDASSKSRLARAEARGWDTDELARREAHQLSLPVKKKSCAYTIQNDGPIEATDQQVAELLRSLET